VTAAERQALEKRLENWWLHLTPAQEQRLLHWVDDFGRYVNNCERRGWRQLWAWVSGDL